MTAFPFSAATASILRNNQLMTFTFLFLERSLLFSAVLPIQLCFKTTLGVPFTLYAAEFEIKIESVNVKFAFESRLRYNTELLPAFSENTDSAILFASLRAFATYTASPSMSALLFMKVQLIISILFPLKYTAAPLMPVALAKMIFFKVRLYELVSSSKRMILLEF